MDGVRVTTVVGHERLQRVKVPKKGENEERGGGGRVKKEGGGSKQKRVSGKIW